MPGLYLVSELTAMPAAIDMLMHQQDTDHACPGLEKCWHCTCRSRVLFADLRHDDLGSLHMPIDDIELSAGDTLYQEAASSPYVYTLRSGLIKLVRLLPNGSVRIVRLLRSGDLAGIEALNGSLYLQQAIALQDTSLCRIPVRIIEQLNSDSPRLYKQLMTRWHKVQSDADLWLAKFSTGNARKRTANLLLYLADNSHDEFFFLPTREDIGALLSVTTETASRVIADFKRQGMLQTRRQFASIERYALQHIG